MTSITLNSNCPFPLRLHALLQDADSVGFADIISWQPEGKSFKICDHDRFASEIMQKYFSQTRKLKSFQRQLNIYGFRRVHQGPNKGGYAHPLFEKQNPNLCDSMVRKQSSRRSRKASSGEPIKIVASASCDVTKPSDSSMTYPPNKFYVADSDVQILSDFFFPNDPNEQKFMSSLFFEDIASDDIPTNDNMEPIASTSSSSSSEKMTFGNELDHLLSVLDDDDLTDIPGSSNHGLNRQENQQQQTRAVTQEEEEPSLADMDHIFPFKLHSVLKDAKTQGFDHIISWIDGGCAFKVHDQKAFVEKIMPNYFDQTKYESFRRQLNLYGFQRTSRGENRGVISHDYFLECDRSFCRFIIRQPIKGATTASSR